MTVPGEGEEMVEGDMEEFRTSNEAAQYLRSLSYTEGNNASHAARAFAVASAARNLKYVPQWNIQNKEIS